METQRTQRTLFFISIGFGVEARMEAREAESKQIQNSNWKLENAKFKFTISNLQYYQIVQVPRTKYQDPNKVQAPSTKTRVWNFGYWNLFGVWFLHLGIS